MVRLRIESADKGYLSVIDRNIHPNGAEPEAGHKPAFTENLYAVRPNRAPMSRRTGQVLVIDHVEPKPTEN
jgi:hypothetical protein